MDGITFTKCANHLSAQVSEVPNNQSTCKISSATFDWSKKEVKRIRGGGAKGDGSKCSKGIHMPDGSIWMGYYYSAWGPQMSNEDKQVVLDTQKKNKGKPQKGCHQRSEAGTKLRDIKSQRLSWSKLSHHSAKPKRIVTQILGFAFLLLHWLPVLHWYCFPIRCQVCHTRFSFSQFFIWQHVKHKA